MLNVHPGWNMEKEIYEKVFPHSLSSEVGIKKGKFHLIKEEDCATAGSGRILGRRRHSSRQQMLAPHLGPSPAILCHMLSLRSLFL